MMNALSANRAMTALEWVMLLTLSLVWGGSYFFVALAVTALPQLTIVMCRVGIASLALWAFMRFTRQIMPLDGRVWIGFFIMDCLTMPSLLTLSSGGKRKSILVRLRS